MNTWREAAQDGLIPGLLAGAATVAALAACGRRDSGSAIAPINASSHVLWGPEAADVERFTTRHTLPGLAINTGAAMWWALVERKLFGNASNRSGLPATVLGPAATAGLAYLVDYHLVPRRLSPGWELRISGRSLAMALGAMAAGMVAGNMLARPRDG